MKFSRQEYWRGFPFPIPWDFPNTGIKPASPVSLALAGGFFMLSHWGRNILILVMILWTIQNFSHFLNWFYQIIFSLNIKLTWYFKYNTVFVCKPTQCMQLLFLFLISLFVCSLFKSPLYLLKLHYIVGIFKEIILGFSHKVWHFSILLLLFPIYLIISSVG